MYAKRCAVLIKKTRMTETPKEIFEHEIPVLNFKYGPHKIEKIKLPRMVYRDAKSPTAEQRGFKRYPIIEIDHDEEYNRMNRTYGKHEESGQVCVEMAYGFLQERRMETDNNQKYEPMIAAGHSVEKREEIPVEEYDDGLRVFEPEDIRPVDPKPIDPVEAVQQTKPYNNPLSDQETIFKIDNLTKEGIVNLLEERGVEHNPDDTKVNLHKLFMDSMKPVGVEPETEE